MALAENLRRECIAATDIRGYAFMLEEAIEQNADLNCNVAICGQDIKSAAAESHALAPGEPVK